MKTWKILSLFLLAASSALYPFMAYGANLSGTMEKWKPITVDFEGPRHSEADTAPNPFLDYRLLVTFSHNDSGARYVVPGFFAGDGEGGGTGRVWRAYFSADQAGTWRFTASFRAGDNISVSLNPQDGAPAAFDGATGDLIVTETDADASLFYRHGRLESIGDFYFKFADGGYWIKSGLNSPENFLGYAGFDNTPYANHTYSDFINEWQSGDPDWDSPDTPTTVHDGRGIIGLFNYLSGQGVNSIYLMPMNIGADGKDTWPYASETINRHGSTANGNLHFDLSKLEQWTLALSHAQDREIFLHFVLSDKTRENKNELDNATLGVERKLFYREMIARFSHFNALQWNVCEEYNLDLPLSPDRIKIFAQYIRDIDPYKHPVTVHNHGNTYRTALAPFVGDDRFGVMSIQTWQRPDDIGRAIEHFRSATQESGLPVPSSVDESIGINQISFDDYRKRAVWDALFSGGMQEMFVRHLDSSLEDFRQFERLYTYGYIARKFLETELPFWEMKPGDHLVSGENTVNGGAEVFFKQGHVYAIYFPSSDIFADLNLSRASGQFVKRWFNPRAGTYEGPTEVITAGDRISIGMPPSDPQQDWVVLFSRIEPALPPQINPMPGTYYDSVRLTLSSPTPGASIYYTANGADPDQDAQYYSAPFEITADATVKARAYAQDHTPSDVTSAAYIIKKRTRCAPPQITPAAGTYAKTVSITLSTDSEGASIHYTMDGTAPDQTAPVYSGPFEITTNATVKARAYSTSTDHLPSDVATADYIIIPPDGNEPQDETDNPAEAPTNDPSNQPADGQGSSGGGGGGCFVSVH